MAAKRPDHVCCLCSKRHRHGAKSYDPARVRCAKNCTRKPIVVRPFRWVGKGACCICGATTPRGRMRCAKPCGERVLKSLKALRHDDAWVRREYELAMAA